MDRLPTVVPALRPARRVWAYALLAAVYTWGCDDADKRRSASVRRRIDSIKAKPQRKIPKKEFCDVLPERDQARTLAWPELDAAPPGASNGEWRWLNVWATWCKPCIEEMPMLVAWHKRLREEGSKVQLILISADESADEMRAFITKHHSFNGSLRLKSPDDLDAWVKQLQLDSPSIPIHVLVDPAGAVRCVRGGGLHEMYYDVAKELLSGYLPVGMP